jgi:hypothetical protein
MKISSTPQIETPKLKIIICFRHMRCICRKWWRGLDYSWHVQHLLREIGRGRYAEPHSMKRPERTSEGTVKALHKIVRAIRQRFGSKVRIIVCVDSGVAREPIMGFEFIPPELLGSSRPF